MKSKYQIASLFSQCLSRALFEKPREVKFLRMTKDQEVGRVEGIWSCCSEEGNPKEDIGNLAVCFMVQVPPTPPTSGFLPKASIILFKAFGGGVALNTTPQRD